MSRGVLVPSYRKRIGYQAMLLGGMATLVSALLVLGDTRTREPIALRQAEDLRASLAQVLPTELYDNDLLADTLLLDSGEGEAKKQVYIGRKGEKVSAVAFEISGQGYGGEVASIMALDRDGTILGVRVLHHAETPGLGDKIEIERDDWILDFNGRTLADPGESGWKVKKDGGVFDQFTGATITPRAVVGSVYGGVRFFSSHREEILASHPPATEEDGKAEVASDKMTAEKNNSGSSDNEQ